MHAGNQQARIDRQFCRGIMPWSVTQVHQRLSGDGPGNETTSCAGESSNAATVRKVLVKRADEGGIRAEWTAGQIWEAMFYVKGPR
jgi:hypothetical protein